MVKASSGFGTPEHNLEIHCYSSNILEHPRCGLSVIWSIIVLGQTYFVLGETFYLSGRTDGVPP